VLSSKHGEELLQREAVVYSGELRRIGGTRMKAGKLKNLSTFLLAFLIVSSAFTFPALAAEQFGSNSISSAPRLGIFNWLKNLIIWLFSSGSSKIAIANPEELSKADFNLGLSASPDLSNTREAMVSSIKELALAAIDYRDNFNEKAKRTNFIQAGKNSITATDNFIENTRKSDSVIALELKAKLTDFKENINAILTNTERNKVTKEELNQLINGISSALGKRYEKVVFDKYEEREIRPRVLGAGGEVKVHSSELTLPPSINSTEPLPEDYGFDIDTNITPEIQALADKLNKNPARIYWWVHENIRYIPYYGAMHGAQQTLISRTGNDIDHAILLVALFRASGYPARYVYGEAYATRQDVFELLGVNDVPGALRLLWGTGIPAEFDGVGFKIERVWVETYTPIYPGTRPQWIQLDASWKKAGNYTKIEQYIEVNSTINATELQDGATANTTINETEGYIKSINITFIEEYLNTHINTTQLQNITEAFFVPEEKAIPEEIYFPLSMQFDFNKSYEYSTLPSALKWKINLTMTTTRNNTILTYQNNLTEIAGLPFVIDFVPTTQNDYDKMQNTTFPAYEIHVTPQLWLNDTATNGTPIVYGAGVSVNFSMSLIDTTTVSKWLYAGEKSAIVIDAPRTEFTAYNKTFERAKGLNNYTSIDNATYNREFLNLIGIYFSHSSDFLTNYLANSYKIKWGRSKPAITFVTKDVSVESFGGIAVSVRNSGTNLDLKFDQIVTSGAKNEAITFNVQRGFVVSAFESIALEQFYNTTAVSTARLLYRAMQNNVTIYTINQSNIAQLESLSISEGDKQVIKSLVERSSDYLAIVPVNTLNVGNWNGIGYIIFDSKTGAGKYLISGGLSGGSTGCETPLGSRMEAMGWGTVMAEAGGLIGLGAYIGAEGVSLLAEGILLGAGAAALGAVMIVIGAYTAYSAYKQIREIRSEVCRGG